MGITEKIKSNLNIMTRSESDVAAYFLGNYNEFAFDTLDGIAKKINTSTTSVLRFCRKIGYDGYKPFQEAVRAEFKYQLTLPDKFERTVKNNVNDTGISQMALNAVSCIEQTFRGVSPQLINKAAEEITHANRVFCFGMRESFALAHYAYTRFLTLRNNVFMLSAGNGGEIESVLSVGKGDVCIFFLFHRYTKQSPEILKQIKKQGARVILITSPPFDMVEKDASILLPCFVDINGIKNSAVAPVCLIDYLCNSVVVSSGHKALEYMKKSEILLKDFTL